MYRNLLSIGALLFAACASSAFSSVVGANTGGARQQPQQHVPSLLDPNSFQNVDLRRNFNWQAANLAPHQQAFPSNTNDNNNNALNWLALLSPSSQQSAGYNYYEPQSTSAPIDRSFKRRKQKGSSAFQNQQLWQQYLSTQQSPIYGGGLYSQPFGFGGWPSLYTQALLAQLLYNPLSQQGLQQYPTQPQNPIDAGIDGIVPPKPQPPPKRPTGKPSPPANDNQPNRPRLPPPVTTPPPVIVPVTSTTPRPKPVEEKLTPLKCETSPAGGCYALVRTPMRYADAISHCKKHSMYLASATDGNIDLLNRLVTEALSKNDTNPSRPCHDRITMLANFDGTRHMRYGSYSFTMGGGACATAATADDQSGVFYDVCTQDFDCTLVDWNAPNPFICAKDDKYEPWCVEPIFSDSFYDYFVTCKSIPDPINELKYPPMCLPFEYGDQVKTYGGQVMKFKHIEETKIITHFILPQLGAYKLCVPDIACGKPSYQENQYGLCRTEKNLEKSEQLVQLWPRNTINYRFAGWPSGSEKNVTQIRNVMSLLENSSDACLRFREIKENANSSGYVQITPNNSPNSCSIDAVGRKSGIQVVAYGSDCFNKTGLIMRPLLHQVGIPAEHTRFDRDNYLTVNQNNIRDDPLFKLQAVKQPIPGRISLATPYDFDSVTHYPPEALAKQKNDPVFVAKNTDIKIGQRTHLSDGDKLKLRTLYGECPHH